MALPPEMVAVAIDEPPFLKVIVPLALDGLIVAVRVSTCPAVSLDAAVIGVPPAVALKLNVDVACAIVMVIDTGAEAVQIFPLSRCSTIALKVVLAAVVGVPVIAPVVVSICNPAGRAPLVML